MLNAPPGTSTGANANDSSLGEEEEEEEAGLEACCCCCRCGAAGSTYGGDRPVAAVAAVAGMLADDVMRCVREKCSPW